MAVKYMYWKDYNTPFRILHHILCFPSSIVKKPAVKQCPSVPYNVLFILHNHDQGFIQEFSQGGGG